MGGRVTAIELLRIGDVPLGVLDDLAAGLARTLRISCRVRIDPLDAEFAFDVERGQFYATAILQRLAEGASLSGRRLAIASADLYVPVLTFVFGEAQLGGTSAVVSLHRLSEGYYGLPENALTLRRRVLTEALHEVGHTFGLRHCDEWQCAMSSSHSVERIDLKESYCAQCLAAVRRLRS